eukprot:TRINITY_DN3996_c0_g1_i1.p1 TRINITY_DN3996_c0_g1~~TRINITY_DN3996_c0_g1_i1.p1  ORF type:complete len:606 (+),score=156.50 TRINITY_DN3996_c0_g1_i1:140-1819(+)
MEEDEQITQTLESDAREIYSRALSFHTASESSPSHLGDSFSSTTRSIDSLSIGSPARSPSSKSPTSRLRSSFSSTLSSQSRASELELPFFDSKFFERRTFSFLKPEERLRRLVSFLVSHGHEVNPAGQLCIRYRRFGNQSLELLRPILPYISELYLWECGIVDEDGAKILVSLVKECGQSLRVLDVRRNRLGSSGAVVLFDGLVDHPCLEEINLANNGLSSVSPKQRRGSRGVIVDPLGVSIGRFFVQNHTLQRLHLWHNEIEDATMFHVCRGLQENHTLCELNLESNRISDGTAFYLRDMLRQNTSMIKVELRGNFIGVAGEKEILLGVKQNGNLESYEESKPIGISSELEKNVEWKERDVRCYFSCPDVEWVDTEGDKDDDHMNWRDGDAEETCEKSPMFSTRPYRLEVELGPFEVLYMLGAPTLRMSSMILPTVCAMLECEKLHLTDFMAQEGWKSVISIIDELCQSDVTADLPRNQIGLRIVALCLDHAWNLAHPDREASSASDDSFLLGMKSMVRKKKNFCHLLKNALDDVDSSLYKRSWSTMMRKLCIAVCGQ